MGEGGSAAAHALTDCLPELESTEGVKLGGGPLLVADMAEASAWLCRSWLNWLDAANVLRGTLSPACMAALICCSAAVGTTDLTPPGVRMVPVLLLVLVAVLVAAVSLAVVSCHSPWGFLGLRRLCGGALGNSGGGLSQTESLLKVPCIARHVDGGCLSCWSSTGLKDLQHPSVGVMAQC
jgi:hypothetical protein